MNMFKEAAQRKAREAARQIAAEHEQNSAQSALARDVADQLMIYLIEHPALQEIEIGFEGNVVRLSKTVTKRALQIACCGDADAFSLVEQRPDFPSRVGEPQPPITSGRVLSKDQMTREVTSWLAA